jgi:flagellar M-ring protein FliF
MDFLNKAIAQITDLFRSMTPGARITAGLLLAVLVVSLGYLFNHQSSSPDDYLMSGDPIPSAQLPAIYEAFAKAKLSGYEIDAIHRIRVPGAQKAQYMAALADASALPSGFGDYMSKALVAGGPLSSPSKQKELIKIALERELAKIISAMSGIESAAVLYDVEMEPGLSVQRTVKTASVSVKPQGNDALTDGKVQMIRQLVAGAIGCKPTDVSVADLNTDRTFPGGGAGGAGGSLDNAYAAAKQTYEQQWEEKIRDALAYIPMAKVKVNVELNPETEIEQTESKIDPKPVPIDEEENSSIINTQSAGPGGAPGLGAQRGVQSNVPANLTSSSGAKSETETRKTRTKNAVTQTQLLTKKAPLTPNRVTVTVGVPRNYYEKVWREKNPTPAGSDPKPIDLQAVDNLEAVVQPQIEALVANLIPPVTNEKVQQTTKQVTVMTFQQLPSAPIVMPSTADKAILWFSQYWSTLGTIGLGMVSLLVLRSMVRVVPAAELPRREAAPVVAASAGEEEEDAPVEQQEAVARLKRRAKSGPTLRDELVGIVREDPDAAANILQNWIGSAT